MSAVVPNDLTGMVPHPTKLDCWIPGERHQGNNLCMEIPMPTTSETQTCTLNSFGNYCDFSMLPVVHLVQIKDALWKRGGGPEDKIIQSYPFGATRDQELPQAEVDQYAEMAIKMYLGDVTEAANRISEIIRTKLIAATETPYMETPKKAALEVFNEVSINWKVQIYNNIQRRYGGTKANLMVEHAVALMPDDMVEEFCNELLNELKLSPKEAAVLLKTSMEEHITMMSAFAMHQSMKESGNMKDLAKAVGQQIEKFQLGELVDDAIAKAATPDADEIQQRIKRITRKTKVKGKGAKRRNHINMGNATNKRILGANLLHKLGTVQQQHTDATKRALLKELPAADLVEVATGKKLPDYQANLINQFQAKADPTAPIVTKMTDGVPAGIRRHVEHIDKVVGKASPYEVALDAALDQYLDVSLLPEGVDVANFTQIKTEVKAYLMEKRNEELLSELQKETGKVLELTEQFEDSMPRVRIEWSEDRGESFHVTREGIDELVFSTDKIFEDAADDLQTTIAFVEDRAKGNEFLKGLDEAIREFEDSVDMSDVEGDQNGYHYVYRRLLVGYVAGFVKGMADAAAKIAKATSVETNPAELG